MELAIAWETAEKDAQNLSKPRDTEQPAVNYIGSKVKQTMDRGGKQAGDRGKPTCHHCGKNNHVARECKYKSYSCNTCGTKGHLASVCRNKKTKKKSNGSDKRQKAQNFLEEDLSSQFNNLYHLNDKGEEPVKIKMPVGKEVTVFEIDSGSPISAVSVQYFNKRADLRKLKMGNTTRIFRTYSGGIIVPPFT